MAEINTNINVGIDASNALASLKLLQRKISEFQTSLAKGSAAQAAAASSMQRDLINNINATGKFAASIRNVTSTTESFTNALEKNKLSMGQYFRYAGASTKTFGRLFATEFNTIEKVARERVKTLQTQYIKLGRNANGAMKSISVRPLALDMENLATKTAMAAQKQQLFNQLVKQGSTNLLNFGKNTQWAGRQLMVGFTIPLTYLGVAASRTFMKMEEQAIRFKRVYGDTFTATEETDKMLRQVQELAQGFTKYGVAVEKTMAMAADAAAMGKQGADLLAQVNEATRLAVLGGVEQEQALETTISLTNAFGIAADQLTSKINFLNAVENQTVTSIEDLTIAVPKAGPVIQQLGGDVEDLAFFLTAMREGGINASEGANALKSGLASLINPTEKASKFLEGFGINIKEIVEANKGDVKGLVIDFAKALETLDPLQKAQAVEQLFGKFQFARLSTLFQNVIAQGTQAERVLGLTSASAAELAVLSEREMKRIEESPMFKFKKALEDIKVALVPLGEAFLKAITPLIEFGTDVLKKFNEMDAGAKNFIVGLTGLVGVIGPVAIMTFGLLANGVANIIKLFMAMKNIFAGAGRSTQDLGAQTQYMTQEQLEAAAVAASLDQTHSKLIQTFSSESKAVDALTQAYNRAIQAQQRYNAGAGGAAGRRVTPKVKARDGLEIVPGPRGAGDIVPALLAPGEAIIPAKAAEENRNLIRAMINGEIPKYEIGEDEVKKKVRVSANKLAEGKGFGTFPGMAGANVSNPQGMFDLRKIESTPLNVSTAMTNELLKDLRKSTGVTSTQVKKQIEAWEKKNAGAISSVTKQIDAISKSAGPDAVFKDPKIKQQLDSLNKSFQKEASVQGSPLQKFKEIADKRVAQNIKEFDQVKKTMNKLGLDPRDPSGKSATKLAAALPNNKFAQTLATPGTSRPYQGISKQFGALTSLFGGNFAKVGIPGFMLNDKEMAKGGTARSVRLSQEHTLVNEKMAQARAEVKNNRTGQALVKAKATVAKQEKETAKTVAKNVKDTKTNIKADSKVQKAKEASLKVDRSAAAKKAAETRKQNAANKKAQELSAKRSQAAAKGWETRRANRAAASAKSPVTSGRTSGGIASGALNKAGMVAGAASMAAVGLSMAGGEVGAAASQAIMPLMALSMVLPMLGSTTGLVVAGLAAAVGAFIYLKSKLDEATKSGLELGKSLTMNNDKLEQMAEFTGKASASSIAEKEREMALSGREGIDRKFGQTFMESESGKALLADAEKMTKNGMSNKEIATNFANQLSYAIVQGVVTTEQARSIAAQLGTELKNQSIAIDIMGQLTQLFGKNGENLLEGDPLEISLAIQRKAGAEQEQLFENAQDVVAENSQDDLLSSAQAISAAAIAVGAAAAVFTGGISLAVGGVVAAGAGLIAGAVAWKEVADEEENNKARAVSVQYGAERLAQNQGLLDSLEYQYDQQIAALEAEKATLTTKEEIAEVDAKIAAKQQEKVNGIQTQKEENAKVFEQLIQQSRVMGGAFNDAVGKSIDERYKDASGALKSSVDLAKSQLSGMSDSDFKATLQLGLASGEIDPNVITSLIQANTENGGVIETTFNALIKTQGSAEANQVMQLLLAGGVEPKNIDVMLNYFSNSKNFSQDMAALQQATSLQSSYGIDVDLNVNGEEKLREVSKFMTETENLPDTITKEILTTYKQNTNLSAATKATIDDILANWDELSGGDNKVNYQVIVDFATGKVDTKAIMGLWMAETGWKPTLRGRGAAGQMKNKEAEALAWFFGDNRNNNEEDDKEDDKKDPDNNKPEKKEDPLANLLKRMKAVRNATTNVAGGFAELNRVLRNGLGTEIFKGTNQKLMQAGYDKEFIDWLDGLDEETRKRFITIKNGVVTVTEEGKRAQQALREIRIGDYEQSLVEQTQTANNQIVAFDKLTAAGMKTEDAWELIQNGALASAIALGATDAEIQSLIKRINILNATKVKVQLQTPEGIMAAFNEQFGAIQEFFAAKEAEVNRKFAADTAYLTKAGQLGADGKTIISKGTITAARDDIQVIQDLIDDLQYELDGLSQKEDAVNKKYEKRQEALEKVFEINQDIAAQQESQLDIAQALTSGDIAAAARAMQEKQKADAARAKEQQMKMLDTAKEKELANLRSASNKSRLDIEKQLLENQNKIAKIEEERLEPAEKLLRDAEKLRDVQLEAIGTNGYLGKTKAEWDAVASATRLAAGEAAGYGKAITDALLKIPGFAMKDGKIIFDQTAFAAAIGGAWGNVGGGGGGESNTGGGGEEPPKKTSVYQATGVTVLDRDKAAKAALAAIKSGTATDPLAFANQVKDQVLATRDRVEEIRNSNPYQFGGPQGQAAEIKRLQNENIRLMQTTGLKFAMGGLVPKYFAAGGWARGTDTVPAMLTPGEFVMRKYAVDRIGVDNLRSMNNGANLSGSVYNYEVNVNVKSDSNPDQIAKAVISQIRQIDGQRIRGNRS